LSKIIELLNSTVTTIFDVLLYPTSVIASLWGLLLISILSGIILLLVYGKVSNQAGIKSTKRRIYSYVLESVLFRHDLNLSLKAQGNMFLAGFKYFVLAVPPILIMMIPCLLILAQLNLRYSSQPLKNGDSSIVSLTLDSDQKLFETSLIAPEGISVTPPLRDLDNNSISWRLNITNPPRESKEIQINIGSETVSKPLILEQNSTKIPSKTFSDWWWSFLYPGDSIARSMQGMVKEISISYPERSYNIFGIKMHWLVVFIIISLLSGIVGSKIFKVEI